MQSEKQLEVRMCRQGGGSPWCWEPGLVALSVTPEPEHHPQPPVPPARHQPWRRAPAASVRFATPPVGQPVPEATVDSLYACVPRPSRSCHPPLSPQGPHT